MTPGPEAARPPFEDAHPRKVSTFEANGRTVRPRGPGPMTAGRVGPAGGKPWRPWRSAVPIRPATATNGPAGAGSDEDAQPREVTIVEAR